MNIVRGAFQTPWKVWNRLGCWIIHPWMRILMAANGITWNRGWSFYGVPIIQKHSGSKINFGSGLSLRSASCSNPLGVNHPVLLCTLRAGALIEIGENFGMTGGAICAAKNIRIGNNVIVGANSTICDTDFHPVDLDLRRMHPQEGGMAPVTINDDAFIGMNCHILKGVTIGTGAVVGAGSIVVKDVPPRVSVAGNPARILRKL